ncbi:Lyzozyme M1 (1,4-beta-N-acetylmuramidase) [Levilactobacillus senmaizukei DSM 21775 = NBRC 103853]|uniref:Lyzozyme M1 (1,4-beta-N-acetylmuramidase) n=1 Tax=Levilactobacillus senmaizukei DSM 21775 = NBRC 103853 TaxID=1423803 RepID=A0A0R2DSV4_9LACO|nr:GH25 family lysozyme [Levilactobacillus senmaizukei]KRN03076.1 Lyzozyme M1 (1,4-beta-N-acetylmuramidase) [Levilactobacillus senmaizukei DSM 21775 = NBRC 103853]
MKRRDYQPIYDNTFHRHRRARRWGLWLLACLVIGLGVFGWQRWQHYEQQRLANYPVRGVTITQDSGYLDFQSLAKHYRFAYLQATSGATYTDDDYSDNYSRAQGADILIGVTHTFSFTSSAQQQYQHFIATTGHDTGTLPIMINVGYYDKYNNKNPNMAAQGQKLESLVRLLKTRYRQGVVIYAKQAVLDQFVKPVLPEQTCWIADGELGDHADHAKFVEYQANGTINQNGQGQTVGFSVFNGRKSDWDNFSQ